MLREGDAAGRQEAPVERVLVVEHLLRGEGAAGGASGLGSPRRGHRIGTTPASELYRSSVGPRTRDSARAPDCSDPPPDLAPEDAGCPPAICRSVVDK